MWPCDCDLDFRVEFSFNFSKDHVGYEQHSCTEVYKKVGLFTDLASLSPSTVLSAFWKGAHKYSITMGVISTESYQ